MFDSSDIDGRGVKLNLELIEVVVTLEDFRVNIEIPGCYIGYCHYGFRLANQVIRCV